MALGPPSSAQPEGCSTYLRGVCRSVRSGGQGRSGGAAMRQSPHRAAVTSRRQPPPPNPPLLKRISPCFVTSTAPGDPRAASWPARRQPSVSHTRGPARGRRRCERGPARGGRRTPHGTPYWLAPGARPQGAGGASVAAALCPSTGHARKAHCCPTIAAEAAPCN